MRSPAASIPMKSSWATAISRSLRLSRGSNISSSRSLLHLDRYVLCLYNRSHTYDVRKRREEIFMAELSAHPTLPELQRYMDEICQERGWTKDTYAEKFLLFTEEVGEL